MLVLKYEKTDSAAYISHIDLLNHVARIVRRAGLKVNFSKGFNPHMLVWFSPPLPLGVSSTAEYVTFDSDENKTEFLEKFNGSTMNGMKAVKAFCLPKNPNLAAGVVAAKYVLPMELNDFKIDHQYEITVVKGKGKAKEETKENVFDRILSFEPTGDKTEVVLASGIVNLRVDKLASQIANDSGKEVIIPDIVKTNQYILENEKLIDVDEWLLKAEQ